MLPVLTVSDPLPTSPTSTLAPGTASVLVTVARVAGAAAAPVRSLTFAAGPDGEPLVPQHITPLGGGHFRITPITPPVKTGTGITIHLRAVDSAGSTIEQTVTSAYTVGVATGDAADTGNKAGLP